jgi:hypothetical protein
MKKILILIFFIATLSFFVESCGKCTCLTSTDPCNGLNFKFDADVQPVINASCATSPACHGANAINSGGPLLTYDQVFEKRALINVQVSTGTMPPQPDTLGSDQKNKIICWLNSGAPHN